MYSRWYSKQLTKGSSTRCFSTKHANSELVFARRCDNGQGNQVNFQASAKHGCTYPIDFTYSTFWNDFSHYSYYVNDSDFAGKGLQAPMAYDDLSSKNVEDLMFIDKEKYVTTSEESTKPFAFVEVPLHDKDRVLEVFQF